MRQLKHHEKKLLRKVDLYAWKTKKNNNNNNCHHDNLRVAKVMRRYHIQNRNDYTAYSRIVGMITKLSAKLKATLPAEDTFRIAMTDQLLTKLANLGLVEPKQKNSSSSLSSSLSLQHADQVTVSALCRRRLAVVMVRRLKMAQHVTAAATWIEQGQVRIGPTVVTDPSFLVSKQQEDFVTWVDQSKIRRTVQTYNDQLDDYDLL